MKKLKVVQILPEIEEGRVEGETLDFAIYLAEQGYDSMVISGGGRLVSRPEEAGVKHITFPHIGEKSFHCLKYINKLRKYFQEENVDIIHLRSRLPAWLATAATYRLRYFSLMWWSRHLQVNLRPLAKWPLRQWP